MLEQHEGTPKAYPALLPRGFRAGHHPPEMTAATQRDVDMLLADLRDEGHSLAKIAVAWGMEAGDVAQAVLRHARRLEAWNIWQPGEPEPAI